MCEDLMAVWYLFPSAHAGAASGCARRWQEAGYRVAVAVDRGAERPVADLVIEVEYAGYYAAVRDLVAAVRERCGGLPPVVVAGGDDIRPADARPEVIAAEFAERFPDLLGVMQPVGDFDARGRPFGGTGSAAVSPWIGRGWIERMYGGRGPHWCGYHHLHGDEEMRCVAVERGIYWERRDLAQYHEHWTRGHEDHLTKDRRQEIIERWPADRDLFNRRRVEGWPGC